jgi:hypothetical protein
LPATIPPSGSLGFQVHFAPTSAGAKSGTISIATNDPDEPTRTVACSGTGVALPTISAIADQTIDEDGELGPVAFTVADIETTAANLVVSAISANMVLVPASNIVLGGTWSTRTVRVKPALDQFGSTLITVTVSDGNGGTASEPFLLTVNSVNDLPTISAIGDQTIDEDGELGPVPFTVADIETTAANLVVSATSANTVLVPASNIVLGGTGSTRTVRVKPALNQFGSTLITVTVSDGNGGTASDSFLVTVTSKSNPDIEVTPPTLTFGNQLVGSSSASQTVTIQNTGSAPLGLNSIPMPGDYIVTVGTDLPASVPAGGTLSFQVRFAPNSPGLHTGTITISSDDPDEPTRTVVCTGTGVAPHISVSPAGLHFAMRAVNTISPPQTVAVRNAGTAALTVHSIVTDSSEFLVSGGGNLPASIAAGGSLGFEVRFSPTSAGAKSGTINITSDDPSTQMAKVTCDGVAAVGPQNQPPMPPEFASYAFVTTTTSTVSSAQAVFVVNNTTQPGQVTHIEGPPDSLPFHMRNLQAPLPITVPPGGRIKLFDMEFAPTALGSFEAMVQITTDVPLWNPVMVRFTGRSRHPSLPDFYTDPQPVRLEFDQLKYSAGDHVWLKLTATGPRQERVYLASPKQDDIEAVDLVQAVAGADVYHQVQVVVVADSSSGHFDGTLAAAPGDYIFAFVHDPTTMKTAADFAFVSGGAPQGLCIVAADPSLAPVPASVPGRPGEPARGMAALTDERNFPTVIGDDQLIIEPRDLAELNDFLIRYDGRVVDDGRRSKNADRPPRHHYYLVRVNLDRADTSDFEFVSELAGVRGPWRISSDGTRRLLNVLLHERLQNRRVALNPRVEFFSQPQTVEDVNLLPDHGGSDAFQLNYVRDCVQKVNRAWMYVAMQDRDRANGVTVPLAIIDDGFCATPDLAMFPGGGYDLAEDDEDPTGPRVTIMGADWHGAGVASTAGSLLNDGIGAAGSGGQVAEMMFYRLGNWGHVFDVGTAIDMAVEHGARVINMSLGLPCRLFGSPTLCEADDLGFWVNMFFVCPILDPWLEGAQDLLAGWFPARITCEEILAIMAVARERMAASVEDALAAGVSLVASAGNGMGPIPDSDISDFDIIPASLPGVIAVGAMDTNYNNTEFFGRRVDVWAMMPVRAWWPDEDADDCGDGLVIDDFGQTSGGSAFVAGIVALMRALNPDLTPGEIRAIFRDMPPGPTDERVRHALDAYAAVRTAGTRVGLPDLQLLSPGLGFDESFPVGLSCPGLWPPHSHSSDDTPATANSLQLGANLFTDRGIHPFFAGAGQEADVYRFLVPANLPANAAYDVELQTVYPTAAGDLLPHPDAFAVDGLAGFPDYSSATYRRSGLFWRDDAYFSVQGNAPFLANRDNVYSMTATISRREIQPDRYDRAPLGNPPNNRFSDSTQLPNPAGGDDWEITNDNALFHTWKMRVSSLNFHTPDDVDFFCLNLPPEALDDCNNVNNDCPFEGIQAMSNGRLVLRVAGTASAIIKLNGQGEELERDENYLEFNCRETTDRIYFEVVGNPDESLDYEVRITYTLPDAGAAERLGELCRAWPLPPEDPEHPPLPLPSSGDGFDVINTGQAGLQEFLLGLPCSPIKCDPVEGFRDYLLFHWNQDDRLEMEFQHEATDTFGFTLRDFHLNVVAQAERMSDARTSARGPMGSRTTLRLNVSRLPAGYYLIQVTGHRAGSAYTVQFLNLARPTLDIARNESADSLTISWPSTASGFVLETTSSLSATPNSWSEVTTPYQTNTTHYFVTVSAPTGTKFYRLHKP